MYEETQQAMTEARTNLKNEKEIRKRIENQLNECESQAEQSRKEFLKAAKLIAVMAFKKPKSYTEVSAAIQPVNCYITMVQQISVIKKQLTAAIEDEKIATQEYNVAKKQFEQMASITGSNDNG